VEVTSDKGGRKEISTGGGGGGVPDFGGRNGESDKEPGTEGLGTEGLELRALEIGWWSYRPRICDCFYCARGRGNDLQAPFDFAQGRLCGAAKRPLFARMGFVVSQVPKCDGPGHAPL
jgi:hypothetical protein